MNVAFGGALRRADSRSSGTRSTPTTSPTSGASASASVPAPVPASSARSSPRKRGEEGAQPLTDLVDLSLRVRGHRFRGRSETRTHRVVVTHASTTFRNARRGSELIPVTIS